MKHRIGYNRLERRAAQRRALLRGLVTSLFRHGRIKTTKAKAKEARRVAEKLITRAKIDNVHNRRAVARLILDKGIVAKLFNEIAPEYLERPGGYTRILKLGQRDGDAAEVVFLELVEGEPGVEKKKKRSSEEAAVPTEKGEEASKSESVTQAPETGENAAAVAEAAAESEGSEGES